MPFNHRQRISALGHVVALVAIVFLCYTSFMGMVYLSGGRITTSAMVALAMAAVLFILAVAAQKLKATSAGFKSKVRVERAVVLLLVLACGATWWPFSHFFSIYRHEGELTRLFKDALGEVMPMFDDYETASQQRMADYQSMLDKVVQGKGKAKQREQQAKYGVGKREEGKPDDGDQVMSDDMMKSLKLMLFPPTYNTLRQEAQAWVVKAEQGASTWNTFLMGNTREIEHTATLWQRFLVDKWSVTLNNEPAFQKDAFVQKSESRLQAVVQGMQQVTAICGRRSLPPPYALLLAVVCWLLVFLPYWLQSRHSKSWVRLLPSWMKWRVGRDKHPERDVERITQINTEWDKNNVPPMEETVDDTAKFKKLVHQTDESFLFLMGQMEQGRLTSEALLQMLAADHNLLNGATVRECLRHGVMTEAQLTDYCGIDRQMVEMLGKAPEDVLPEGGAILQMPECTTEVYFWGIPSSGKTCALGVILAAAREGSVVKDMTVEEGCQGYVYQEMLSRIFPADKAYCLLPGRTPVDTNYAIQLHLEDWQHRDHPVTLVDMAGELFCALLWQKNGRDDEVKSHHLKALQEFEKILVTEKSEHQKFHVFIIEYGAENKKYKGFDQDTYLEFGLSHLDDCGVLEKATEGIYVLVTKTDQVKRHLRPGEDEATHLSRYLRTYYPNFMGLLDKYCLQYELCGGKVPNPIPFDIGEVCFCNCCRISTERARDVVKVMLARSKGFRKGLLGKIERWMDK